MLILKRRRRLPAPLLDFGGVPHHLVDGLFAGQLSDILLHQARQFRLAFAAMERPQAIHHHGHHHVYPPRPHQRHGSIEIKDRYLGLARVNAVFQYF